MNYSRRMGLAILQAFVLLALIAGYGMFRTSRANSAVKYPDIIATQPAIGK